MVLQFAALHLTGGLSNQLSLLYAHLNEIVGVFECAKLELYRQLSAPYEDRKIDENGDVYQVLP
ncbi:MAG: hypothetical protein JEZ11_17370 [Desulfobacterales bacterium]|nr:hypothetical protein [Desulfobacterales bacterium]